MMHIVKNKHNFKVIAMTPKEAICKCYFGIATANGYYLVDDNNNSILNTNTAVYYVAVLNRLFGKESLRKWLCHPTTKKYKEDEPYEIARFEHYIKRLTN